MLFQSIPIGTIAAEAIAAHIIIHTKILTMSVTAIIF